MSKVLDTSFPRWLTYVFETSSFYGDQPANYLLLQPVTLIFIYTSNAGKFIVAYVPACREKEYYLACACEEIYAPSSAYFSLFGLTVQASFLRGKLILLVLV